MRAEAIGAEKAKELAGGSSCPNCGEHLAGEYCPNCGQKRIHKDDLTVKSFIKNAVGEFFDVESGILKTFGVLLFQPGRLTAEYLEGKQTRYLSPFKIYLVSSAAFFLLAWGAFLYLGGFTRSGTEESFAAIAQAKGVQLDIFFERFAGKLEEFAAYFRILSVLLSGLMLGLIYLGAKRYYYEHLIFSLHYFSFEYISSAIFAPILILAGLALGGDVPVWTTYLSYILYLWYIYRALKTVYKESVPKTAFKAVVLLASLSALYIGVIAGAGVIAVFLT